METVIFLLHGLGCKPITLYPLEKYLNFKGYNRTHRLAYPVDRMSLAESIHYVDTEMQKHADKKKEQVILIGQSMGGRVANNLHKKGWRVKCALYIGSPLHGANLLNQLEAILPTRIRNWLYKKPYDDLKKVSKENAPPHPYHTFSMGWLHTHFDGCVYKNEAMLDAQHHTHLGWSDHRTIFLNPRLWFCVHNFLEKHTPKKHICK